jgi:hypothetical protein
MALPASQGDSSPSRPRLSSMDGSAQLARPECAAAAIAIVLEQG